MGEEDRKEHRAVTHQDASSDPKEAGVCIRGPVVNRKVARPFADERGMRGSQAGNLSISPQAKCRNRAIRESVKGGRGRVADWGGGQW